MELTEDAKRKMVEIDEIRSQVEKLSSQMKKNADEAIRTGNLDLIKENYNLWKKETELCKIGLQKMKELGFFKFN